MDEFNKDTENFITWLEKSADVKISQKIEILDLRHLHEGRAVVTKEDVAKEEVLFEIPYKSLINIQTSQIVSDFPAIKDKLQELGQWNGLIVCLLYEWEVLGTKSKWWPYLKVLPTAASLSGLMYWTDEQLEELRPSLVLERIGKEGARQMFDTIVRFFNENGMQEQIKNVKWDNFLRVASTIMSYSFDVENPNSAANDNEDESDEEGATESLKSMVPFADTLNADTHKCNAHLEYDTDGLKMCAIMPIPKGGQVYNIYGEHPNSEILRRYGYVEQDGSAYDFGEVLLQNIKKAVEDKFGVNESFLDWLLDVLRDDDIIERYFEDEEIVLDSYDCYISGEILTELVLFLQIVTAVCAIPGIQEMSEEDKMTKLKSIIKRCLKLVEQQKVTRNCGDVWKAAVKNRLAEYPSGILTDKIQIDDNSPTDTIRKLMAKIVLKSECQSLTKCLDSIDDQYEMVEDQRLLDSVLKRPATSNGSGKSSHKRQKN